MNATLEDIKDLQKAQKRQAKNAHKGTRAKVKEMLAQGYDPDDYDWMG